MLHVAVLRTFLAIFCIAIGCGAGPARAQRAVPPFTAHVTDETGTLGAAERERLEARLAGIEQRRGTQIAVLMVRTTAPEDIAAFANRVGNAWKIGRKDVGDGVLVVVARDDRRMRIEVAKALEGAIPDIAAARIIDEAMKPRFRAGDYAGGLDAAIGQLDARIEGENLPAPGAGAPQAPRGEPGTDWGDFAIFLFFGVMVGGPVARGIFGNRLGGLLMGGAVGLFAFLFTASPWLAAAAGLVALLYTGLFGGRGVTAGRGRRTGAGFSTGVGTGAVLGGWSSDSGSSSSDSGGSSSGGGGDFGGGGASGDW
ncbi:TPM domain-containing protein [Acidovorax sp. NCPPB 2350]|nr:TPM domain-containing protein [Acidovorax sp. NCPPB 2350]